MPLSFTSLPWIITVLALAALAVVLWRQSRGQPSRPVQPPTDWNLAARPVFNAEERRAYRQLHEAFPHHVILSKLPLVRLCQANDPAEQGYWYELLGRTYVSFAICSANGRVLAAIDLESDGVGSKRTTLTQQAVFDACRIRYLRCAPQHLPSVAELQLLVPQSGAARGPQPMPQAKEAARDRMPAAAAPGARPILWQDAAALHDSFFAPDTRPDTLPGDNLRHDARGAGQPAAPARR